MAAGARGSVAVVGGGIAGLTVALECARAGLDVTLLERSRRTGGVIGSTELAGVRVDTGAEALLARRPEAVALAGEVGLGDALVAASTTAARVHARGRLRPLPARTVMGVPGDLRELGASGVLGLGDLARVPLGDVLDGRAGRVLEPGADVAVGAVVRRRLGAAVADRLVEPLLGGVYAGRADELSLRATVPQLVPPLESGLGLLAAARSVARAPRSAGPVFVAPRGGVWRLAEAVAGCAVAAGARLRTAVTVRSVARPPGAGGRWRLVCGAVPSPEVLDVDAVVLAVPAAPAARLLADAVPRAAAPLRSMDAASVAVVSLALPRADLPGGGRGLPSSSSGFLVPPSSGSLVKGATVSSAKWGWYAEEAPDLVLLRMSVGRHGDARDLQRDDRDLVRAARDDLARLTSVTAAPVAAAVTRWGGALPQYAVGHLDRVAAVEVAVGEVDGLEVCGAAYRGLGVPAVVGGARAAARRVVAHLAEQRAAPATMA